MNLPPEVLKVHRDERGAVFEPLGPDGLSCQRNVHVVLSEPGQVRGNHLHRRGTEVLVVHGAALVRTREGGELRDFPVPTGEVHRFVIPPGVAHAIRHDGPGLGILIGFNTHAHDPEAPDTYPDPILASG